MTVRDFMLKKFPTNEYMDCPVPKHHWETIQEYAEEYHKSEVKKLNIPAVMRSLLLKYQEEWKKAKANSKRTTKGGYDKVDLKEWGKMEAFAMIMDDLARMQ